MTRQAAQQLPDYRTFVFRVAFWMALGMALFATAGGAMGCVVIVSFSWGMRTPTLQEIYDAQLWMAFALTFTGSWFVNLINQNDKWIAIWKELSRPAPTLTSAPRPIMHRTHQEMAHNAKRFRVGEHKYLPPSAEHYAELYHVLHRNNWRITRRHLNVKVGSVPAFTSLTENYKSIVNHWQSLGWVNSGELTETGQAVFRQYGNVRV